MDQNNGWNLFGFQIKRKPEVQPESFVAPSNEDGGTNIDVSTNSGAAYNAYSVDLDPSTVKNEIELVKKYREISLVADIDIAVDEIVNEVVVYDEYKSPVVLDFSEEIAKKYSDKTKDVIKAEFNNILNMLNFNQLGSDIVRSWYVDGKLAYHKLIDKNKASNGIVELRQIDVAKLKRIIEIKKEKDTKSGVDIIKSQDKYFIYSESGFDQNQKNGLKISEDAIAYVTSGLVDKNSGMVLSYLHKAIRPMNQLRMIEDSEIIYRMSRAPQRRIFYIDTDGMQRTKAEQHIKDVMARFKNKQVYDINTGTVNDAKKHMSILEDYFMPRSNGCFSLDTKVKLLDGRDVSIADLSTEYESGKENWTYSVSPEGSVVPGLITWAGTTKTNTDVIDVYLDNGEIITCTPEHKFILRNGEKVEAQHLQENTSLMPLYTEKRKLNRKYKDYEYVLDNATGKWSTTHKMVVSYFDKPPIKGDVIHHININRFDNTPNNLRVMSKLDHITLHSTLSKENWANATPEKLAEWCERLSISGKEFFASIEGTKRKLKISEENKTNQKIIDGFTEGRENSHNLRRIDQENLSKEEFYEKWCKQLGSDDYFALSNLAKLKRNSDKLTMSKEEWDLKWKKNLRTQKEIRDKIYSEYDLNYIITEIGKVLTPNIKNSTIIDIVNIKYKNISLKKFRTILRKNGYDSVSEFMIRNFEDLGQRRKFQSKIQTTEFINHRVLKVVIRDDKIDVGTLTVDGNNLFHDYHNYALTAGVFVMNSKGTEITTLEGGGTLGDPGSVGYYQNKLYQSLNIPLSRLTPGQGAFNLGRENEISREEVKFSKFIDKLRKKLNSLFLNILGTQLVLKGIATEEDWLNIKNEIHFNYSDDNFYSEIKESEMLKERMSNVQIADPFIGKYFSKRYIQREILKLTDDQVTEMEKENSEDEQLQAQLEQQTLDKLGIDPNNLNQEEK